MKVLIISDIHGSGYYAEKIKEIEEKEKPEEIIILGDLYYHGPRNELSQEYEPMKVAKILNSMKEKLTVIRGNCDAEVDEMISDIINTFIFYLSFLTFLCVFFFFFSLFLFFSFILYDFLVFGNTFGFYLKVFFV